MTIPNQTIKYAQVSKPNAEHFYSSNHHNPKNSNYERSICVCGIRSLTVLNTEYARAITVVFKNNDVQVNKTWEYTKRIICIMITQG